MRRVLAKGAMVVLVLVLLPVAVFAQASITGVVRDSSGAVLPGVTVEAASPTIIEKVRTAVTDGAGRFLITELRPGAYTVTFTLPGFNTIKRDGINLTGAFTASVDAEMRVGAVEETITVTGEAPLVDVQSATRQRVMDTETISQLPTGRNMFALGVLMPGVSLTGGLVNQDIGGALGPETRSLVAHGGRQDEQRFMMNGVSLSSMIGGGWGGGAIPNATGVQEMVFDTAAVSADLATGGVRINFIAREGSNQFHGTMFGTFSNSAMQGFNVSDELLAVNPALRNPGHIDKNWDFNPGFGGPLKQDKLWFFASGRYQGAYLFAPSMFYNKNANDVTKWNYDPDLENPASLEKVWKDAQLRMTWQASARNKIGMTYTQQDFCACHDGVTATVAPEAAYDRRFPTQRVVLLDWTSPVTNKILIEASGISRVERWGNMHLQTKNLDLNPDMIGVVDQAANIPGIGVVANLNYRSRSGTNATPYNNSWNNNFHWRFNVSYITGSHAFKVGTNDAYGYHENQIYIQNPLTYRFNNGVPNQITLRALPHLQKNHVDNDFGLFAQDKWTIRRLTLSLGVRYDHFANTFPEQVLEPTIYTPTRNVTIPETKNLSYHDITPKSQLVYDLFGNGKTAIKMSLNKYLQGLGTTGPLTGTPNPIANLSTTVNRAWVDGNRNYVVDCAILNPAAQDNTASGGDLCGLMNDAAFGRLTPTTVYDPAIMTGWGKRNFNWEFSSGVQHEVLPRVSLDVSYFRRWYGNFLVTDNRAVSAADYDAFAVTAPSDPRLPSSGTTISGFKTLSAAAFGRAANNFVTLDSTYGSQMEHWNGVDINVNTRLANGVFIQGGTGTGRTSTDNCEIVAMVPEAAGPTTPAAVANTLAELPYCHVDTNWLTSGKGTVAYTIPKVDVSAVAIYQNLAGPELQAYWNAPSATIAESLGRPLAGNTANQTLNLTSPGQIYGDRQNLLDLRFAKIFRFGSKRTTINFDIYNVTNAGTILSYNNTFVPLTGGGASWQVPTAVLQARFIKLGGQLDW